MATLIRTKSGVATTGSLAIGSATTFAAGNLVVVLIRLVAPTLPNITSVTDDAGNVYTKSAGPINDPAGGEAAYQYWAIQQVGGGTTVTVTFDASPTSSFGFLQEFNGGGPIDATSSAAGSSGTSASVPALTPAVGELAVAGLVSRVAMGTITPGAGYTLGLTTTIAGLEYSLSSSTSETAPISWANSSNWMEILSTFFTTTTSTSSSTSTTTSVSTSSTSQSTSTTQSTSTSSSISTSTTTAPTADVGIINQPRQDRPRANIRITR